MDRLSRVRARLRDENLEAIALTDLTNIRWLTGFTGTNAVVIVTGADGVFLTDSRYTVQAKEQVTILPVEAYASPTLLQDFVAEHVVRLGAAQLGIESRHMTVERYEQWKAAMPDVILVPTAGWMDPLRWTKDAAEIAALRKAVAMTDRGFEHLRDFMKPGMREDEIEAEILAFWKANGVVASFDPIVVSGEKSARPHGRASDRRLRTGDFVTIDMGAKVDQYCGDLTRTFVVGEPTARHREIYDTVRRCCEWGVSALVPGANGREIDREVRVMMGDLAPYFGHGLGHGLGLEVHDPGRLSEAVDQPIAPGQVWTVEPGIYVEGFGGVRIEDNVLVTENGPELLSHFVRELVVIG